MAHTHHRGAPEVQKSLELAARLANQGQVGVLPMMRVFSPVESARGHTVNRALDLLHRVAFPEPCPHLGAPLRGEFRFRLGRGPLPVAEHLELTLPRLARWGWGLRTAELVRQRTELARQRALVQPAAEVVPQELRQRARHLPRSHFSERDIRFVL